MTAAGTPGVEPTTGTAPGADPGETTAEEAAQWPGAAGPPGADPGLLDAELRERAAAAVAAGAEAVRADPWRQAFHVQPPVGLLNDPNGLVQHDGLYHLCYQWHPFAAEHGLKFWAHLTSTDLVHWQWQEPALVPSEAYESHGCYSGSGIVHDDAVRFVYTGNVRTSEGGRTPFQLLATLDPDGRVVKHPANPLVGAIPGCTAHVRDPKVWRSDGQYWMLLGAQTEDLLGTAVLLRSPDLVDWTLLGAIAGGSADPLGYMWECPDLMRLADADVLVISPQFDHGPGAGAGRWEDRTMYALGELRLDPAGFHREGPFRPVNAGPDFYAPQSFVAEDGRTILVGWMGMPDHDDQPALPDKHPSVANGWVHCLTVPREVSVEDGMLVQRPVAELASVRGPAVRVSGATLEADTSMSPGTSGTALDIELRATCSAAGSVSVRLREGEAGRPVVLTLDPHAGTATLDRRLLGTGEGGMSTGSFRPGPSVDVRILLDRSSIEVFVDGGRLVLSARIYPVADDDQVAFDASGAAATVVAAIWPMSVCVD